MGSPTLFPKLYQTWARKRAILYDNRVGHFDKSTKPFCIRASAMIFRVCFNYATCRPVFFTEGKKLYWKKSYSTLKMAKIALRNGFVFFSFFFSFLFKISVPP